MSFNRTPIKSRGVQTTLADVLRREVSGVSSVCQFVTKRDGVSISVPNARHKPVLRLQRQHGIMFTDASYLKLHSYKHNIKTPGEALKAPKKTLFSAYK